MAQEKNFENKVKKFLNEEGAWFIKYWGGGSFTKAGVPDLIACVHGQFMGIELKAPKGKPTELQLHTLKEIDAAGGFAILLYPDQYEEFRTMVIRMKNWTPCDDPEEIVKRYRLLKARWERK